MANLINGEYALYDSLTQEETLSLRNKCIEDILENNGLMCQIPGCLAAILCLKVENQDESFCSDKIIKLIELFLVKSKTHKLFYGSFKENEIQQVYDLINNSNVDINYDDIDIYLLGQTFIKIVRDNSIPLLPNAVNEELFDAYVNYNPIKQKKIIKRVPFIVNSRNRIFLILLQNLFKNIEKKKKFSGTSKNDLLHIFGPIVFKGNLYKKQVHGYHRMVILEDVLNTDMLKVDKNII